MAHHFRICYRIWCGEVDWPREFLICGNKFDRLDEIGFMQPTDFLFSSTLSTAEAEFDNFAHDVEEGAIFADDHSGAYGNLANFRERVREKGFFPGGADIN